jgi:GNAT superfamily N-acetyltransferase
VRGLAGRFGERDHRRSAVHGGNIADSIKLRLTSALTPMIRSTTPDDTPAVMTFAEGIGLFGPAELAELSELVEGHAVGTLGPSHRWIVDEIEDDGIVGVAYFAQERMTSGTWNLYLIAVREDLRGSGRGAALLRHVEQMLVSQGSRVLLVETAGIDEFEATRAFYRKNGFSEEARIRDFYEEGVDKVVFWKALSA